MTSLAKMLKYSSPLKILTDSDLEHIHSTSTRILEDVGVKFDDERTLELFAQNSCQVDSARRIVKIGRDFVDRCLKKVPRGFTLYSRRLEPMKIGGGDMYFVSAIDNSYIIDGGSHQRRTGRLSDVTEIAKLMDELAFHHICCPAVIAHDEPPALRTIYAASELLRNTGKHCIVCSSSGLEARSFIKMGAALAGSENELVEKPIISTTVCTSSPLNFPKTTCDVLWQFAARGIPFVVVHGPIAGATSPVTMAGTVSVGNAENLAGIVLSQLIRERTPVVYGGAIMSLDMRYGWPAYGAVEYGLFSIASAQMGRYYGIPSYGAGGATSANLSDAQSGYEKMSSSTLAYLAGHDMMCDASLNANQLTSLDSIVIQDEILAMLARLAKGFDVNEDTMAFDIVEKVGPGGDFLSAEHTRNHFRTDFYYSELSSRRSYQDWLSQGGLDMQAAALERAKQLIQRHTQTVTTAEENRRIDEILAETRKDLAVYAS